MLMKLSLRYVVAGILIAGLVLCLILTAAPALGQATTIELTTTPPVIDLGAMAIGATPSGQSDGKVTCNEAGWTVTATDQNTGAGTGHMRKDGTGTALTNEFQIQKHDDTWVISSSSVDLVTGTGVTGEGGQTFTLYVKQGAITYDDVAGTYNIVLVITAALAS